MTDTDTSEMHEFLKRQGRTQMALSKADDALLRLLLRSPDRGEGWRTVSKPLWRLVESFGAKELLEIESSDAGGGRARLSERGLIIVDYI